MVFGLNLKTREISRIPEPFIITETIKLRIAPMQPK
jgi:hypothetical protein